MKHHTPKKLLAGPKISTSHQTVIPDAKVLVMAAKELSCVKKVVPSVVSSMRPGKTHIKFIPIQAGVCLQVRGVNSVQIFFIYTTDIADIAIVQNRLSTVWKTKNKGTR